MAPTLTDMVAAAVVVAVKFTDVCPASKVTDAGTVSLFVSELLKLTVVSEFGTELTDTVHVPVEEGCMLEGAARVSG